MLPKHENTNVTVSASASPAAFPVTDAELRAMTGRISSALGRNFRLTKDKCDDIARSSALHVAVQAYQFPGKISNISAVAMTEAFRRASKEQGREQRLVSLCDFDLEGLRIADPSPSPEEQVVSADRLDRLMKALDILGSEDRSILVLVMAKMSNKQIALLRELPVEEVTRRRTSATRKLRRYMEAQERE